MLLSAVSYNECTVGLPHGCCWVRHQNGWCRKYYSTLLPGHNACREEPFSYGWFSLLWDTTTKRDNALKSGVIFILWCKDSKDTEVQVTEQYHTTNKANTINTSIILINMTTPHKYWNSEATPSSLTLRQETKCTSFHFTSLFSDRNVKLSQLNLPVWRLSTQKHRQFALALQTYLNYRNVHTR